MVDIKHVDTGKPVSSPYSPGLIAGNTLYVSGQVPVDKDGKVPNGIEEQTAIVLSNLKAIIEKAGGTVVATTAVFTEGERAKWKDIIALGHLPIFTSGK